MFQKILREPLLHFIVIALLFFVAYKYMNPEDSSDTVITVSEGRIALFKNSFIQQWNREPLPEELDNVIQSYILNEAYVREARSLGLDQGDTTVNLRLRQKMDYMLEDLASVKQPTEAELKGYYSNHQDDYVAPSVYNFKQIFISSDKTDQELKNSVSSIRAQIENNTQPTGEVSMLPEEAKQASSIDIERKFGPAFIQHLEQAPVNHWHGPIDSAYGKHFVLVYEKQASATEPYDKVKDKVLKDWQYQQSKKFRQSFEKQLLDKYQANIESPVTKASSP